jgi:SAM-dependent methyltransferase
MASYAVQTVDSPNPLARYAHRTRVRKSIELAKDRLEAGRILDYGCGSGVFVAEINRLRESIAFGYEPFMEERSRHGLPIYRDFEDLLHHKPFGTVTLFETIEHLSESELSEFLQRSFDLLGNDGCILISAPIEIGPSLFLKELNRFLRKPSMPNYGLLEFFKAALLGTPARRAENIKASHKGFDFRAAIRQIEERGWRVDVIGFSPIPFLGWYGNSQVFFRANKLAESKATGAECRA